MNVLISVGPIPSRLDSVKFVTNRFKGGLALKTAEYLKECGLNVTIVSWKFTELKTDINVIRVNDVVEYYNTILNIHSDAYILAAAVANLMPSNPYQGKFPSHLYSVGEKFNIEFEIAPRVIDEIKKKFPRSVLVGYKLYDGDLDELICAAKKTLFDSKSNIVFANHPDWAKKYKYAVTQDGSCFKVTFEEHLSLLNKLINEKFYKTTSINENVILNESQEFVLNSYPKYYIDGRIYGTFAYRTNYGFITTSRGKMNGEKDFCKVLSVDHDRRIITTSSKKASLNAPLLDLLLKRNPNIKIIIHGHDNIGEIYNDSYEFAGSSGDLNNCKDNLKDKEIIQLKHHGFIICFESISSYKEWLNET